MTLAEEKDALHLALGNAEREKEKLQKDLEFSKQEVAINNRIKD